MGWAKQLLRGQGQAVRHLTWQNAPRTSARHATPPAARSHACTTPLNCSTTEQHPGRRGRGCAGEEEAGAGAEEGAPAPEEEGGGGEAEAAQPPGEGEEDAQLPPAEGEDGAEPTADAGAGGEPDEGVGAFDEEGALGEDAQQGELDPSALELQQDPNGHELGPTDLAELEADGYQAAAAGDDAAVDAGDLQHQQQYDDGAGGADAYGAGADAYGDYDPSAAAYGGGAAGDGAAGEYGGYGDDGYGGYGAGAGGSGEAHHEEPPLRTAPSKKQGGGGGGGGDDAAAARALADQLLAEEREKHESQLKVEARAREELEDMILRIEKHFKAEQAARKKAEELLQVGGLSGRGGGRARWCLPGVPDLQRKGDERLGHHQSAGRAMSVVDVVRPPRRGVYALACVLLVRPAGQHRRRGGQQGQGGGRAQEALSGAEAA